MGTTNLDDLTLDSGALVMQTASSGLVSGAGTSGATHALGSTAGNALEYYLTGTHTTGDMRGMYLRLYFDGANGSGEAARIFGTVNNVTAATGGTVNGAHISLSVTGASGAVSGAGNALRATFGAGAGNTPGGTCAVIQVDTDFNATATIPGTFAFLRFTDTSTGKALHLMNVPDVTAATDCLFAIHTTQTMSHSLHIISADGTDYYIMCSDTATNRTEA